MLKNIKKNKNFSKIYSTIKNSSELGRDIKEIYNNNIENEDYTNLYEVLLSIRKIINILFNDKDTIEKNMEKAIRPYFGENSSIIIYKFDSDTIELGFTKNYQIYPYQKIIFKINNLLEIENNTVQKQLYQILHFEIKNLITLIKTFNYLENQYKEKIRAINSNLKINITLYNIEIYILTNDNTHPKLQIKYSTYEDKYYIQGEEDYIKLIKGIEKELLHKIYINLKDCPAYCQNEIKNKRAKKYKIKKI